MAEENRQYKSHENESTTEVDVQDRGVFDFLGKKKEQEKPHQQEVNVTEFDNKVKISDEPDTKLQGGHEPEKKQTLLDKLHRSNSSSSSSSDEEKEGEDGEKKKKKKEKEKEKVGYGDDKEEKRQEDTADAESEEKKGFLDKIKEKLPGQNKKAEEVPPTSSDYDAPHTHDTHEGEINDKEKKGLLDKIKEKLPGHHTKPNEDKEKEINATSN